MRMTAEAMRVGQNGSADSIKNVGAVYLISEILTH